MDSNPFADPFQTGPDSSKSILSMLRRLGGHRAPRKPEPAPEPGPVEAAPVEEAPAEEKQAKAVLRNPKWEVEEVGFNEETEVSVEAELPQEHAHKTKVVFELFAKTPDGPERIAQAEGQIKDGKAKANIPVYIPQYKDESGSLLAKVEYSFTAKHSASDLLQDEKVVKVVDHLADKLILSHVLEDVTFATGKSFPRPTQSAALQGLGAAVAEWRKTHPEGKVAVFGHADAVGQEDANKTLSERRARAIQAYLGKDSEPWEALYGEEKWGIVTTQELLKHLGHDPGALDGQDGPKTQAAVKAFQEAKSLAASGNADPETRKSLYLAFMEDGKTPELKAKDFDAIDGQSYAGCSEFNLLEKTEGASEANRRVAVLLLKANKNFPIQYPCKHGDAGVCRKQAARKGERRTAGFKCLFYDQLVHEEKKGGGGKQVAPGKLKLVGVKEGEALKQYVNLKAGIPGQGQERLIEVEVEGAADGAKVFWKATAAKENSKRNSPKPGLKPDGKGALAEFKAGVAEMETQVKGGKASCLLACGLAGGDRFELEIGLEKGKPEAKLSVVNWRKLYYQLTVPKGVTPAIDKFNEAMKGVHVDCEKSAEVEVPLEDGPAGSWVNGEDLGRGTGRKLAVGSHNRDFFHKKFKAAKKPIEAHLMFCHFQLDGAAASKPTKLTGKKGSTIAFPGEKAPVPGLSFGVQAVFPGFKAFPIALQTGKPSATADWASKAASGPHKGKKGTIPADHLVVNFKDHEADGGKVFVKFPKDAATVVEDGEEITVSLNLQVAKGWYNGESAGHLLLIAAQRTKADGKTIDWEGINGTMGHEMGHAMQMVAATGMVIPGIADVRKAHTRWYDTTRGHQGDHCAKGIPQAKYDDPKEKMSSHSGTCVMFGAGVAGRSHLFCELCAPLVQGVDLSKISA